MDNHTYKFELGVTVKDIITGYTGVIMGRSNFLTGCDRYGLTLTKLTEKGGKPVWEWFDDSRLRLVKNRKKIKLNIVESGFDGNDPVGN